MTSATGVVLVGAMWWYAALALWPARALGADRSGTIHGLLPVPPGAPGLGPRFSRSDIAIETETLDGPTDGADFDGIAERYERYVRPFSHPVFSVALAWMSAWLRPGARVLDLGCGPGAELRRVARLVPHGEVVGVDVAADMVRVASERSARSGITNAVVVRADAARLPRAFTGAFDLAFSCFAHHHFQEPQVATRSALESLRPGGVYCLIDVGEPWFSRLAAPLARWADPGWVAFSTPNELRTQLLAGGAARAAWVGLLPGVGMAVGQVPLARSDDGR